MPKPQFETELSEIFELFKSVMKKEKLKYRDLAKRLEMSESGLKKIFSAGDCSFNRLSQIAATLDLSLSEIFDDLRNSTPSQLEFAQSTDRFLSENFDYFRFYWRLFYERMSVEEIQKSDALSKKQVSNISENSTSSNSSNFTKTIASSSRAPNLVTSKTASSFRK